MNVVDVEINIVSYFGDYSVSFEGIVNVVNVVIFYVD